MVIESAGHQALRATDLQAARRLAMNEVPHLVVLGHTFTPEEQDGFAQILHQSHPQICILLLRSRYIDPVLLLKECRTALHCQPGTPLIREMR
jgi:DNA-binding response OmpR family regulator